MVDLAAPQKQTEARASTNNPVGVSDRHAHHVLTDAEPLSAASSPQFDRLATAASLARSERSDANNGGAVANVSDVVSTGPAGAAPAGAAPAGAPPTKSPGGKAASSGDGESGAAATVDQPMSLFRRFAELARMCTNSVIGFADGYANRMMPRSWQIFLIGLHDLFGKYGEGKKVEAAWWTSPGERQAKEDQAAKDQHAKKREADEDEARQRQTAYLESLANNTAKKTAP